MLFKISWQDIELRVISVPCILLYTSPTPASRVPSLAPTTSIPVLFTHWYVQPPYRRRGFTLLPSSTANHWQDFPPHCSISSFDTTTSPPQTSFIDLVTYLPYFTLLRIHVVPNNLYSKRIPQPFRSSSISHFSPMAFHFLATKVFHIHSAGSAPEYFYRNPWSFYK